MPFFDEMQIINSLRFQLAAQEAKLAAAERVVEAARKVSDIITSKNVHEVRLLEALEAAVHNYDSV